MALVYEYSYPLLWPAGFKSTADWQRKAGPFKVAGKQVLHDLMRELELLGAKDVKINSDRPVNRDGNLSMAKRSYVSPACVIYFKRKGREVVLACDQYADFTDNMRAISKTIEAMRGIERWGSSDMLDRAFTGFAALPSPEQWWQVLGVSSNASAAAINEAYRQKSKEANQDPLNAQALQQRLNVARDQGLSEERN